MDETWVKHPDTEAQKLVPSSALPSLAASGWQAMTKTEVAAKEKELAQERAARVASLTPPDLTETATATATDQPEPSGDETTAGARRAPATEKE